MWEEVVFGRGVVGVIGVVILIAASGERLGSWMGLLEARINLASSTTSTWVES